MQKISLVTIIMASVALPALSQVEKSPAVPQSECGNGFKASDTNNDGFLTVTEISKVPEMPKALEKERALITRAEFVAACGKAAQPVSAEDRTVVPADKGEKQPQGFTGPVDTKSHGAPAESPQGQSPPGMQAAPDGSSKIIVEPDGSKK